MSAGDTYNATDILSMQMHLEDPLNTSDASKMGKLDMQYYSSSVNARFQIGGGFDYSNSSAVNAVRLYSPTATFTEQATCQPLPQ